MKKILLLTFAIMFGVAAFAQGPGYMGRHFLINAECNLSPSWLNPNPLTEALKARFPDNSHAQRYLGLNYFVNPSIEMIITRNSTVGLGYNFYKSPFEGRVWREWEEIDGDNYHWGSWNYNFTGTVTAHGFSAFYKIYPFDSYAPLGYYLKFTFDGFFYHFDLDQSMPRGLVNHYPEMAKDHGVLFGARFEMGRDYLLFNYLRLSMGLSVGTTFGGFGVGPPFDKYDKAGECTPDSYVRNRILNAYWFGLKVGVGVLAF